MFESKEAKKSFLRVFENARHVDRSTIKEDTFVLDYMQGNNGIKTDCCAITLDARKMKWIFRNNFHKTDIKFNKLEYEEMVTKMYNKFPEMKNYYNFVKVGGWRTRA